MTDHQLRGIQIALRLSLALVFMLMGSLTGGAHGVIIAGIGVVLANMHTER
jgi:hypothetical protein